MRPRQWLAHSLIGFLRPGLSAGAQAVPDGTPLPVVIVGFLSSPSGLGQAARLAAAAYRQQGFRVLGIDLSRYFYETAGNVAHGLEDGRGLRGPGHVIVNINAPYLPYVLWLLGRGFLAGKHVTGYWAWELPDLPANWQRGYACVHDIAVPSRFVADALCRSNPGRPVAVAPHPVVLEAPAAPDAGRRCPGPYSPERPFTVLSVLNAASGFERKNPLALIRAFRLAFAGDPAARLRMLVSNAAHYPGARQSIEAAAAGAGNIDIAWDTMDRDAFLEWRGTPDLYASLHRAEGFGLPLAEAMCAGYPVLATGWSGNMEFMDGENSFLVDYRLVEVRDMQFKYPGNLGRWAEPDVDHAAGLMRRIRAEPAWAAARAEKGRADIRERCGAPTFCARIEGMPAQGGRDRAVEGEVAA